MNAIGDESEDPAEREKREDNEYLDSICARLGERFDTVRIIATRNRGTGTRLNTSGGGNWFGQVGSVREWLTDQDESSRENICNNR